MQGTARNSIECVRSLCFRLFILSKVTISRSTHCRNGMVSFLINLAFFRPFLLINILETLGKTLDIVNDSCVNIPQSFLVEDDGVSGVWTKGPCVVLYEVIYHFFPRTFNDLIQKFNCDGDYIKVRKGKFFLRTGNFFYFRNSGAILNGQLSSIDFDNRARSSGPCEISQNTSRTEAFDVDPVSTITENRIKYMFQNTLLIMLFCIVNGGMLAYLFIGTRMEKVTNFVYFCIKFSFPFLRTEANVDRERERNHR